MLAPWPTSKSACYKQDMLLFWYRVEFDRSNGLKSSFFFAAVKIPSANTTLATRDYLYFIANFLSDKIEENEMGGSRKD